MKKLFMALMALMFATSVFCQTDSIDVAVDALLRPNATTQTPQ